MSEHEKTKEKKEKEKERVSIKQKKIEYEKQVIVSAVTTTIVKRVPFLIEKLKCPTLAILIKGLKIFSSIDRINE